MKSTAVKKSDTKTKFVSSAENLQQLPSRKAVAQNLQAVLADTFLLYIKTLNFHWNVEGQRFVGIHTLTDMQYKEMQVSIDEIAERLRALGFYASGSAQEFLSLSDIIESSGGQKEPDAMLEELCADHMRMAARLEQAAKHSEEHHDHSTTDLFSDQRKIHEKSAWMLRSLLM